MPSPPSASAIGLRSDVWCIYILGILGLADLRFNQLWQKILGWFSTIFRRAQFAVLFDIGFALHGASYRLLTWTALLDNFHLTIFGLIDRDFFCSLDAFLLRQRGGLTISALDSFAVLRGSRFSSLAA